MKMASSTMLGIVLAVTIFGAGVVTDRLTNVYITNFPVDEQGNLKIKTAEKPLQTYNDSVEITLLDWTEITYSGTIYGITVYGHEVKTEFPFAFSSKQTFQSITHIAVMITLKAYQYQWKMNITLNGKPVLVEFKPLFEPYPTVVSMQTNDLNVLQAIVQGINTLTIGDVIFFDTSDRQWKDGYLWIFRAAVFIEYEYKA